MRRPVRFLRAAAGTAALIAALASACQSTSRQAAAAPPARKLTTSESAQHVLSRLAFGARPGQFAQVAKVGWKNWAAAQLDPAGIADESLEARVARECPSLGYSLAQLESLSRGADRQEQRDARERVKNELRTAVLLRAVNSERQFQEVIVDFWRNHLNVDVNKVPFLATHYEEHVLRKHAFDKFENLLLASARHPAMLVYLDNYVSNRQGLNENYARELMELHTLGVDNGYTQDDVVALARALTGWTCGWRKGADGADDYTFFFNDRAHDSTPAAIVGLALDGSGGMADGETAIRHLARHENTSRFISGKLCKHLVSDDPSPELVERASAVFRRTEGDLREVYRAIIFDPEFTSAANFRTKVKTPFEFMVSVLRMTDADLKSPQRVFKELQLMGQPVYECLEPTGYSDAREAWLDPGVMVYRWNVAIQLVTGKLDGVSGGPEFVEPILQAAPDDRPRKVIELLLPGLADRKFERLLSFTADPRVMTAYALGSPNFQQQ
jgi:uncharacterized protein (DUF1800 family)